MSIWFLKSILGVQRTTTSCAFLRECGHEPLQFYSFCATVKFYNSMLGSNSKLLKKVLKVDWALQMRDQKCWTAEFLSGLQTLQHGDMYRNAVVQGQKLCMHQVVTELRSQQEAIWRSIDGLDPRAVHKHNKLAAYHNWFARPLSDKHSSSLPRYLHLNVPKHVLRAVSRFRLKLMISWLRLPITITHLCVINVLAMRFRTRNTCCSIVAMLTSVHLIRSMLLCFPSYTIFL